MEWKNYSKIKGQHAFLGASKFSWLNYDEEKLATSYFNFLAVARGTRLHALAAEHIELGIKMPKTKKTLDCYINDAIGFGMKPEQVLFYSDNCFGTADAIAFKKNFLRIHDLKTGVTPAHFEQLQIYAALFCLDYKFQPEKLDMELRIYQNDDISIVNTYDNPELREDVRFIANKIVEFDRVLSKIKEN